MEAAGSSELLVPIYQTTLCHAQNIIIWTASHASDRRAAETWVYDGYVG
jgi:hypothetical protein